MADCTRALQIGKYRIDRVLGKGAMGVVYLGFDPRIERAVAIKTVHRELLASTADSAGDMLERFRNEARAAGRLAHPNIVTVYDFGEDENSAYIVMEYVCGKSLDALLPPGERLPLSTALDWLGQLLAALAYAHDASVVHRDIKPANLLVTDAGVLKVADFGVARIGEAATSFGSLIGTPSFMSPEQFAGDAIDGRSDLFSAGVVAFRMLTGRQPFEGSAAAIMRQVLNDTAPRASKFVGSLPPEVDAMVARALATRADERFDSAAQWLAALRAVRAATSAGDDERTVVVASSPWPLPAAPAAVGTPAAAPSGASWPPGLLERIERHLAVHIGPLASLLVRRAAAEANDLPSLAEQLGKRLPDAAARRAFEHELERLASGAAATSAHPPPPASQQTSSTTAAAGVSAAAGTQTATAGPIDSAQVDAVARKLAVYLGPIAKVIATREAAHAGTVDEFHRRVERCIADTVQRERFRRDLDASR